MPTPSLDQAPPLPPGLQPPPQQPTMQGLAGSQPDASGSLQEQVMQKLMFIEQTMTDIGSMAPALSGVMDGLIGTMRQQVGKLIQSGLKPPADQAMPTMMPMGQ